MLLHAEINKAMTAHALWKERLLSAIDSGDSGYSPAIIAKDDHCEFGQWLYGPSVSEADRQNPYYGSVRQLHADFHKATAEIMLYALAGKKGMAHKMLGTGSHYASLSGELMRTLARWRDSGR
jgi:hypothetical protein